MAEVKLSQESYDELLSDIKALRLQADTYFEKWQDAKRKAKAFDEIKEMIDWFDEIEPYEFKAQVVRIKRIINDLEEQ